MTDNHVDIVSALSDVLPTHYELTLTSKTLVPCITYMETNNAVEANGNTLGYSRIKYQIKIWGHDIAQLQKYAKEIDTVLRPLGYKRTSSGELYDRESTMIQKIMNYEGLALESFN